LFFNAYITLNFVPPFVFCGSGLKIYLFQPTDISD